MSNPTSVIFGGGIQEHTGFNNYAFTPFHDTEGMKFLSVDHYCAFRLLETFSWNDRGVMLLKHFRKSTHKLISQFLHQFRDTYAYHVRCVEFRYLCEGLYFKFSQNESLRKELKDTGNASLYACNYETRLWYLRAPAKVLREKLDMNLWENNPRHNVLGTLLERIRDMKDFSPDSSKANIESLTSFFLSIMPPSFYAVPAHNKRPTRVRSAIYKIPETLGIPREELPILFSEMQNEYSFLTMSVCTPFDEDPLNSYYSVEHYLARKKLTCYNSRSVGAIDITRSKLGSHRELITLAKISCVGRNREWDEKVYSYVCTAIWLKFTNSTHLTKLLVETYPRPIYYVEENSDSLGLGLNFEQALRKIKNLEHIDDTGCNLLGKALCEIRNQLLPYAKVIEDLRANDD